jgi:hypothetical protein
MGCGAYLAVEPPDWNLPEDWAPTADDIWFETDLRAGRETTPITGVRQAGRDRIEPGAYRVVVIKTLSPDTQPEGTFEASVLCMSDVEIPPGTRSVRVDVEFGAACMITTSLDDSTGAPGP